MFFGHKGGRFEGFGDPLPPEDPEVLVFCGELVVSLYSESSISEVHSFDLETSTNSSVLFLIASARSDVWLKHKGLASSS